MPRTELVVLVVVTVCCFFLPIGAYLTPSSLRIGRKVDRTGTRQGRFRSQPLFVASPTTRTKKGGGTKLADKEREIVRLGRSGSTDRALELFQSIGRPTIRIVNAALDACARARPTRFDQALELLDDSLQQYPHLKPNVFTFGALMSACSRARQPDRALQLLRTMQEDYSVQPNGVVYSSAITACARSRYPEDYYLTALRLLDESIENNVTMSVVGYNAALSACAKAGQWQPAIDLLHEMQEGNDDKDDMGSSSSSRLVQPDSISYATVLDACERGEKWGLVLKYAEEMQSKPGLELDGIAVTSCLHACQQLGMAGRALDYLEMMKEEPKNIVQRQTAGWERKGARKPLKGPDAVAYRLVISACARGGEWQEGIRVLKEMKNATGSTDVMAYTAAINGCEYAGEWKHAFWLLEMMRREGVEPNEVTMASVIGACANACAKANKETGDERAPFEKAMRLVRVLGKDPTVPDPNIVVYNAAIRAAGEALDLDQAMALLSKAEEDGLEPTMVTYGSLMTVCERVGSLEGVNNVFKMMRKVEMPPNEIVFGAALSCLRKVGEGENALLLLRKMIKDKLEPNAATYNTVLIAQTEGRKADLERALLVYKLMKASANARPNRQTYTILIRAFTSKGQPQGAEVLLRWMQEDDIKPDVDLYTATVTAYERKRQPLKALRLMESMQKDGYDFYEMKVLNNAFKNAVRLVNVVGQKLTDDQTKEESDWKKKMKKVQPERFLESGTQELA